MSMDLEVWASQPFELPAQLPEPNRWEQLGDRWSVEGEGWQVFILIAEDDVPVEIQAKLPGAKHVAYVTLEPIGADKAGYALLEQTVRSLARHSAGVWVDPNGRPFGPDDGLFW